MNQLHTIRAWDVAAHPGQRAARALAPVAHALHTALAAVAAWLERNL